MRKLFVRFALLSCAAVAVTPAVANHSWGTYHWASDGTVELTINKAITSDWTTSVDTGIADWNSSKDLTLTTADAGAIKAKQCNPILGQALVCNAAYGQRGWLGIATIWLSASGHIVQATTQLNDTYFAFDFYNTPAWRALVACQEVGHDFGLDHQDTAFDNVNLGTCMDYTRAPAGGVYNGFDYGPSNEHPNKHDYDELKIIYNHDDGAAAAATDFGVREVGKVVPPSMSAPAGVSPAEWGRAIHFDRQGRPNVYERTIAPGRKVLTHVFWAIGEGPGRS
jgi:hypothetical protein